MLDLCSSVAKHADNACSLDVHVPGVRPALPWRCWGRQAHALPPAAMVVRSLLTATPPALVRRGAAVMGQHSRSS